MGNNLIHNYLNNQNSSVTKSKNERKYAGLPSVTNTMQSFDTGSDKLIKPLDGKGHLVNGDLVHMPKEMIRDAVYTTKAFADGVRGKANDHQLGKMNDLGLKLSGIAIATYLMTKKSTPKTKAMEFLGFGAFLASMALWPKLALEIPARLIHGFNFRKQYVDEQGRKKYVSLDPNYIPFDLYKGDKRSEDLDVIGNRMGIKKDIPNRHEAVKDQMRKISVQNNTMWMLTAGIATPIMTALACNLAEPKIGEYTEKLSNDNANKSIEDITKYLNDELNNEEKIAFEKNGYKTKGTIGRFLSKVGDKVNEFKQTIIESKFVPAKLKPKENVAEIDNVLNPIRGNKQLTKESIVSLSAKMTEGLGAEMQEAATEDILNLIGGEKYVANDKTAQNLSNSIHSAISAKDVELAKTITPDKIKNAVSQGIVRGAVRDLLTEIGFEVVDPSGKFQNVSENLKCRGIDDIDFFAITKETENMTPKERLAHNIAQIITKVNKDHPHEDFISGMSELERSDKNLKDLITTRLEKGANDIANNFYEGSLSIGNGRENYVRRSVQSLYKQSAPKTPMHKKLFNTVSELLTADISKNRGYFISDKAAERISQIFAEMKKFSSIDAVLSEAAHFKVEKAPETLVANSWADVSNTFISELGYTKKEIAMAAKDKDFSNKLLAQKLENVCSGDKSYEEFIQKLSEKMLILDEKIDAPTSSNGEAMMQKVENGIIKNCTRTGEFLQSSGMSNMSEKMLSSYNAEKGMNVGSIMSSKLLRLHSRVDGVHSSYMRLIQTADFFHRASGYKKAVAAAGGVVTKDIADKFGFTFDASTNEELIEKGKKLLLDGHTDKFYTKMGLHNNPQFFKQLMWSVYRPVIDGEGHWCSSINQTADILDKVKIDKNSPAAPRRVFERYERMPLGTKLKEHMNHMYNSLGNIVRGITKDYKETLLPNGSEFKGPEARACKRFDLVGKAVTDFAHDTLKQKSNSNKWMKIFSTILGVTTAVTVGSQFLFGEKDPEIKA